jgi:hypothetical protein
MQQYCIDALSFFTSAGLLRRMSSSSCSQQQWQ